MRTALISGIFGQDGSYLAEHLISLGYTVVGFGRRVGDRNLHNLRSISNNPAFILESGDVTDMGSIARLLSEYQPDEFYNLAAQSHVHESWNQAIVTAEINFVGVANCLEAIRLHSPETRFYQASTSEVYGDVQCDIQDEDTPIRPRSPYGAAKAGAEHLVKVYRESYDIFACFGRLFNHESVRRPIQFVTRKVTMGVARQFVFCDYMIAESMKNPENSELKGSFLAADKVFQTLSQLNGFPDLTLGNLDARRDWSAAQDMVKGIHLMLQQSTPKDYVLASGQTRSVKDLVQTAYKTIGIEDFERYISIDPSLERPAEVNLLCGDSSRARAELGWKPEITFDQMIEEMVWHDIKMGSVV